jgi:hypothetical protein
LPEIAKTARANLRRPAEDEQTTGLRSMMEKNTIPACPMYAIFATKLFLTVHHILRIDAVRPSEELQATAKRCIATIDGWLQFSDHKQFANWPAQNCEWPGQIKALAQDFALEDKIGKFTVRGVPDGFQPQAFHFLKRNSVYCGLLTLRLNLLPQEGDWLHLQHGLRHEQGNGAAEAAVSRQQDPSQSL